MSLVFTMSSMGLLLNISSQSGALHGMPEKFKYRGK
jgi:hypothetical protein